MIASIKKYIGIASTALSGVPDELAENCTGTNLQLQILTVTGIATQEDVRNVDAIGIRLDLELKLLVVDLM